MPAAFAHDLFGRLVYRKLDPGIRRAVRREKDCFYLGLFGPDILFFYRSLNDNRIVHKGFWLHEAVSYTHLGGADPSSKPYEPRRDSQL